MKFIVQMDLHALTLAVTTLHYMTMKIRVVSGCLFRYLRLSVTFVFVSLATLLGVDMDFNINWILNSVITVAMVSGK